jgi:hypothetical protein
MPSEPTDGATVQARWASHDRTTREPRTEFCGEVSGGLIPTRPVLLQSGTDDRFEFCWNAAIDAPKKARFIG